MSNRKLTEYHFYLFSFLIDLSPARFYKFLVKNSNYFSYYSMLVKIAKVQSLNVLLIGKNRIQILFQHKVTLICMQPQNYSFVFDL